MKVVGKSRFRLMCWSALLLAAVWAMSCQAVIVTVSLWKTMINNQPRYLILCMDAHVGDPELKLIKQEQESLVAIGKELKSVQFIVEDMASYEGDDDVIKKYVQTHFSAMAMWDYEQLYVKSGHLFSQRKMLEAMENKSCLIGLTQILRDNGLKVTNAEMRHIEDVLVDAALSKEQRDTFRKKFRDILKAERNRLVDFAKKLQDENKLDMSHISILKMVNDERAEQVLEALNTPISLHYPKTYRLKSYTRNVLEARILENIIIAQTRYIIVIAGKDHLRNIEKLLSDMGYRRTGEIKGEVSRGRSETIISKENEEEELFGPGLLEPIQIRYCQAIVGCAVNLKVAIKNLLDKEQGEEKVMAAGLQAVVPLIVPAPVTEEAQKQEDANALFTKTLIQQAIDTYKRFETGEFLDEKAYAKEHAQVVADAIRDNRLEKALGEIGVITHALGDNAFTQALYDAYKQAARGAGKEAVAFLEKLMQALSEADKQELAVAHEY